ncbi:MAG: biopolymer transporter ExbD [Thermodesulfobacteriota bacterium]|jgi:biopolymer transport protein ExbD
MATQLGRNEEFNAEINVTPLVDVVLVLLVIFMVVTPLLKQEVPIELPIADNSREAKDTSQLTLSITADGLLRLNGQDILPEALVSQLRAIYGRRADKTIFLEADRNLPYGRVVDVMDDCRAAGVTTIGVLTKREKAATVQQQ